jgi:hypothetical protein
MRKQVGTYFLPLTYQQFKNSSAVIFFKVY